MIQYKEFFGDSLSTISDKGISLQTKLFQQTKTNILNAEPARDHQIQRVVSEAASRSDR